jgi:hypothetical protein
VTSATERPKWSTGVLWGVLLAFLLVGSLGLAGIVYGLMGILDGDWFALVALGVGGLGAFLAFLFTAGILYRVDRYRGTEQRRVEIFE